jgi:hypothetical protein
MGNPQETLSFYLQLNNDFLWAFSRDDVGRLALWKIPGFYRQSTGVLHLQEHRESQTVTLDNMAGWTLCGGLFANIDGVPRAVAINLERPPMCALQLSALCIKPKL